MKELDWANLSFGYMKTNWNLRIWFKDGKWGEIEESDSEYVPMHIAATCLHYGQEAFEGLKAFRGKDGKVRVFRMEANAERMQSTCRATMMPELPTETFCKMVKRVIELNKEFIPPYESGASLYIRPLLIGTGAEIGVKPAKEYMFLIFVMPVGPYFKGGFAANAYALVRSYDRSAPLGMSSIWMPRRRSISMSAAPPTSSASRVTVTSLPSQSQYCPLSPTRAFSSWLRTTA